MYQVRMESVASYLPGEPVAFDGINNYLGEFKLSPKLSKWADRVQPVMKEILGFNYCYYAFDAETREFTDDNLTMSVKAAKAAIEKADCKIEDIDLLIWGGSYSQQMPPLSTRIQEELGIPICGELQIHANCTSVYKAIEMAHLLLKTGEYKHALVVSSNVASGSFVPEFYNQEVLTKEDIFLRWYLCDGAGAMVFSAEENREKKGFYLEATYMESAGGNKVSAMGNGYLPRLSNPKEDHELGRHHVRQIYLNEMNHYTVDDNGHTIFYNALNRMIEKNHMNFEGLKNFVVNMPSKFVREHIVNECIDLGIPKECFFSAIEDVGYAGPPAAVISIDRLLDCQKFKNDDLIVSFVMEVSKFMQAGFALRYKE